MAASSESMVFLDTKQMNIDICPQTEPAGTDTITEVVFGDMHGNSLKLLALLKKEGIIDIPEEQYVNFQKLYTRAYNYFEEGNNVSNLTYDELAQMTSGSHSRQALDAFAVSLRMYSWNEFSRLGGEFFEPVFNEGDLQTFQGVLDSIRVLNKDKLVTLIGDMLSDRGASDYFTLRILQHLQKEGMKYRITFSNHDMEFIWQFERLMLDPEYKGEEIMYRFGNRTDRHQGASVHHLMACINQGILTRDELATMVREAYYPHLDFIVCSEQTDGAGPVTFLSHTPMSLEQCSAITTESFGIPLALPESDIPSDKHRKDFSDSINNVNKRFRTILENREFTDNLPATEERRINPIYEAAWERGTSSDLPPGESKRETGHPGLGGVRFVHGHDVGKRGANPRSNIFCLDDSLGKDISLHEGLVNILAMSNTMVPELSSAPVSISSGGLGFFKKEPIVEQGSDSPIPTPPSQQ